MASRKDDQTPGPAGPAGDDDRGPRPLPGTVPRTVDGGRGEGGDWSWMPSPPAIAIAVIGMLALGVGLGSAMSEIASSAPLSTILLEYPRHAAEAPPPAEEPEGEVVEEESVATRAPEEEPPVEEIVEEAALPEEPVEEALLPEEATEEPELVPFDPEEAEEESFLEDQEPSLPEVRHAFLIVLGEGGYEETFGAASARPYLSRVLPKKGELLPNYYGVTSGVLANEIALLSGQGPTPATAADCPEYTAITPGTVSVFAEQVEGDGCVYGKEVESLPTQLSAAGVTWRAYVQEMENGGAIGQPFRCRKPVLGAPDPTAPTPEDGYVSWRNPVVYFAAIAAGDECEKHDVGFELLTHDLAAKKGTPALSLIFPEASELKTLVPAIMASPAYGEGGLIAITSPQASQTGERPDPSGCCLAPAYPNLPVAEATSPSPTPPSPPAAPSPAEPEAESEPAAARYTAESVFETGGGGKVGLLMISPFVEPGRVEEAEYANHFTLLKTLETMLGVEPIGYAAEEELPALSAALFTEPSASAPSPSRKRTGAG